MPCGTTWVSQTANATPQVYRRESLRYTWGVAARLGYAIGANNFRMAGADCCNC